MENWILSFWILFVSYAMGSIPFGLIIGRINGIDIRKHGSGNIGATNIMRTCGKKWGLSCFFLDALKGFFAVSIAKYWTSDYGAMINIAPILATAGVVGGHIWSPFLNFSGGKGVATSIGAILAITPVAAILSFLIWYSVFLISRYVSLASIIAAVCLPFLAAGTTIFFSNSDQKPSIPVLVFLFLLSFCVVLKHKPNIQRLLNGTENRFERKKECNP